MLGRRQPGRTGADYNHPLLVPVFPRIIEHAGVDVAVACEKIVSELRGGGMLTLQRQGGGV